MILGLVLALGSALGGNVGFLLKQRGAVLARPIRLRHPARSAVDVFRSRWFLVGWIVSLVAWVLHVAALSLAALSSVQAVLSGGLVFLAVLAERFFGFRLERRARAATRLAQPVDAHRADLLRHLFLRLRPQPANRSRHRGDRDHICGSQPRRHYRRHPRLRGADRVRSARDHRPRARILLRDRRRGAGAGPATRPLGLRLTSIAMPMRELRENLSAHTD